MNETESTDSLSTPTKPDTKPPSLDRLVSLRPGEVTILTEHYYNLAKTIRELANARSDLSDGLRKVADMDEARAKEIRKQANASESDGGVSKHMAGDWTEDANHENGHYWNECENCHRMFLGHKRQIWCKVCAQAPNGAAVRSSELVGLRGTVRCVRCGYPQHDMPLDKLDEYACGKYDMKAGQPCGGGYVAVKKRKQPNEKVSDAPH